MNSSERENSSSSSSSSSNSLTTTISTFFDIFSPLCQNRETLELVIFSIVGFCSFVILCEFVSIILLCINRRRPQNSMSAADMSKENVSIENFKYYAVSYVYQISRDGCLKIPPNKKYTSQEAKTALDDSDYKARAEMAKANIVWYFDINTYESPYFGFSPAKKDHFATAEKNLRKSEKKAGSEPNSARDNMSEGSGVYENLAPATQHKKHARNATMASGSGHGKAKK